MKFLLLLSLVLCVVSKKFNIKVINTPIYNFIPFALHKLVILKKCKFENKTNYNDIFAVDFCPSGNICSPFYVKKLLSGESVEGKIRVFRFNEINHKKFVRELFYYNVDTNNLELLKEIDPELFCIIQSWDSNFQLYKHNCRYFSSYLVKNY
jgi:hypothetical protein